MVDQRNGEWSTNKTQNGRCTKGLKHFSFWDYCQSSNPAQAVIPTCAEPESGLPWMNLTNNVNCYTMALQCTHTPPPYLNMFSSDARNLEKVHTTLPQLKQLYWLHHRWFHVNFEELVEQLIIYGSLELLFVKAFQWVYKMYKYLCIYLFIYLFVLSFFLQYWKIQKITVYNKNSNNMLICVYKLIKKSNICKHER